MESPIASLVETDRRVISSPAEDRSHSSMPLKPSVLKKLLPHMPEKKHLLKTGS